MIACVTHKECNDVHTHTAYVLSAPMFFGHCLRPSLVLSLENSGLDSNECIIYRVIVFGICFAQ